MAEDVEPPCPSPVALCRFGSRCLCCVCVPCAQPPATSRSSQSSANRGGSHGADNQRKEFVFTSFCQAVVGNFPSVKLGQLSAASKHRHPNWLPTRAHPEARVSSHHAFVPLVMFTAWCTPKTGGLQGEFSPRQRSGWMQSAIRGLKERRLTAELLRLSVCYWRPWGSDSAFPVLMFTQRFIFSQSIFNSFKRLHCHGLQNVQSESFREEYLSHKLAHVHTSNNIFPRYRFIGNAKPFDAVE